MLCALLAVVVGVQSGPSPEELIDRLRRARGKNGTESQRLIDLGPRAIPALGRMLQGPLSDRRLAVPILTNIRDRQAMSLLSKVALDSKEAVGIRILAAYGIGNMQFPEAFPALSKLANDRSPYLKWAAVYGFGRIGDPRAIPTLQRLAKSKDQRLAWMSKDSIRNIRKMVAKYPNRLKGGTSRAAGPAMP
jgi:HEAT repeat protein